MASEVSALVKLGLDEGTANRAVTLIHQMDQAAKQASASLTKAGRDMREMGATMGMAGAAILAPLTAAASAYASKFGALESTSRAYIAAQDNMTKASQDFGRVAATALTPIINQLAASLESVAKFAAANPELVKIAAGGGMLLASLGATMAVAGQVITTIGKAKDFVSTALKSQGDVMNGLIGTLGKVVVTFGALYVGANLGVAAVNALGKATGDERLAHFQLKDALNTLSQAFAVAVPTLEKIWAIIRVGALELVNGLLKAISDAGVTIKEIIGIIQVVALQFEDKVLQAVNDFVQNIQKTVANFLDWLQSTLHVGGGGGSIDTSGVAALQQIIKANEDAIQKIAENAPKGDQRLLDQIAANQKEAADIMQKTQQQVDQQTGPQGSLTQFVQQGGFASLFGTVTDSIKGLLSGIGIGGSAGAGANLSGGVNGTGLSPDAVNAFIAYQKQMTDSNRQFQQDEIAAQTEYQRASKASEIAYQQDLQAAAVDYQRKQTDMARQYNQDRAQAERDYQKQIADEDRQYEQSKLAAAKEFNRNEMEAERQYQQNLTQLSKDRNRTEAEAQRGYQESLHQNAVDYQRQIIDAQKKFNQDRAQSELDYQRSQRDLATQRKDQDFLDNREHGHRLQQLAMSGDVMGFIQEQQNYQYDQQTKKIQRQQEDDQNAQHHKDQLADQLRQYDLERQQLDQDNQRKLSDMQTQFDNEAQQRQIAYQQQLDDAHTQFDNEEQQRRIAYQNQLSDLQTQHDNVLSNDRIAYQQQLTQLQIKYQQDLQTAQIAYQQELSDKQLHHQQERQTAQIAYQNQLFDLQLHHQQEQDANNRAFADQISQLQGNLFGLQNARANYMSGETVAASNFFSTNAGLWQNYFSQVTGMALSNLQNLQYYGQGSPIWQNGVPGHAGGLNYVPQDNYLALLHRGERVLNAAENSQYNTAPRGGWTVNVSIGAVGEIVTPSQLQTVVDGVFDSVTGAIARQGTFA